MVMRRRRPLLRAAALGGVAYSAGKRTERNQMAAAEQEARISALEQERQAPDAPPAQSQDVRPAQGSAAGTTAGPSMLDQLNQLATLHQQGALTSEEFAAAKSKLLGM